MRVKTFFNFEAFYLVFLSRKESFYCWKKMKILVRIEKGSRVGIRNLQLEKTQFSKREPLPVKRRKAHLVRY